MNKCPWHIITKVLAIAGMVSLLSFANSTWKNLVSDSFGFWNLVIPPSHTLPGPRASPNGSCGGQQVSRSSLLALRWQVAVAISPTAPGALLSGELTAGLIVYSSPSLNFLGPNTVAFYQALAWWKYFPCRRLCFLDSESGHWVTQGYSLLAFPPRIHQPNVWLKYGTWWDLEVTYFFHLSYRQVMFHP